MPIRWLVILVTCLSLFFSNNAKAQIVVVPPILGEGLEPARDLILERISAQLKKSSIKELKVDRFVLLKLAQCKNKMSCISTASQSTEASHAIHTIVARRKNKVLTQVTLLDIATSNPVERVRARTAVGLSFIEKTITESMQKVGAKVEALPAYQNGGPLRAKARPKSNRVSAGSSLPPPVPNQNSASGFGGAPPIQQNPAVTLQSNVPMVDGPNYIAYTFWGLAGALALGSAASFAMYGLDLQARNATPQTEFMQREELLLSAQSRQLTGYVTLGSAVGIGLVGVLFQLTGWGSSQVPAITTPMASAGQPTASYTFTF
ncbi:MAG: hypothetical protein VYC39_09720 [Myxococcota bacterium]|nr:hypothetical protein [Myxococcota bacterium]